MTRRKPQPSLHDFVRGWQGARYRGRLFEAGPDDDADDDVPGDEPDDAEPEPAPPPPPKPEKPSSDPNPEPEEQHSEKPEDSLDNQIDAMLVKSEDEALSAANESRRPRRRRGRLWEAMGLNEAGEDDDEGSADDDDEEEEVTNRGEPNDDATAPPMNQPKMNIDVFTQKMARLIKNYDSLLDVPRAIIERATQYLRDNYSQDVADQFLELLETQYDVSLEPEDSEYPMKGPAAAGAEGVPSAGGGSIGGGEGALPGP